MKQRTEQKTGERGRSSNVARYLGEQAASNPDGVAVLAPQGGGGSRPIEYEQLSFAQLDRQSDQLARLLGDRGITAGTRVLLLVKPGSDLIRCCFALFKLGAVPVVIDPGMGLRSFLSCVRRSRPEAVVGIFAAIALSRVFRSAFATVKTRVLVGRGLAKEYGDRPTDPLPVFAAAADTLAAILFTSGSTGAPKGVCYTHGQFDAQVGMIRSTFGIEPGEVDLPMLPIFALFNPALGMTTVVPQMNPARPAMADPALLVQAIEQNGITNSFGSPVLWRKVADHLQQTGKLLPTMRRVLMAGAAVPPALMRDLRVVLPAAKLYSPYGATECLPVSAIEAAEVLSSTAAMTEDGAGTCVGRPVDGVQVQVIEWQEGAIADIAAARVLPVGQIGEIIATGPTVTRSYDAMPTATSRAKIRNGNRLWHRMGDAGYLDEHGRLWFCGRIAERVITADGILYTDKVEGMVNTLPEVGRCALIGIGNAPRQQPALVLEPAPGKIIDLESVRAFLRSKPALRGIEQLYICKSLPVDVRHNAKIHRLELARRYSK